ncbi:MAG TPA: hypothetical protein VIL65_12460 [Beijerinckiaceae bacterium]|jgi:hypoxanthine phosphoribosyltransferase
MIEASDPVDPVAKHLAEGEAALVLVESLLLTLIAKGVLTVDEVVQTVESVTAVKRQIAADSKERALSALAAGLLSRISRSLEAVPQDGSDLL